MNTHTGTWPCGTPRSTGNAFSLTSRAPTPAELKSADEKAKYDRRLAARGTSRDEIARKQAERVNAERFSCTSNATNSDRAPR